MRQETMMPCIDLSPSFMKMHLPLKVNLIAQPVQGINLQPLWLLLILTYHQRIFSSFLDTISINASISNSIKKIILDLLTFGIIFSRPLWHLTSWWITLSIGFVNSHRADWWEIQQKMSQNISTLYKKNLQNKYHGITFKLKKDWLGKTLSSRGKWAKTL